ncbi:MAG: hypothetical protein AB8G23_08040 [Myxococcota bacterium]
MRKNGMQIWMMASLCALLLGGLGGCASTSDGTASNSTTNSSGNETAARRSGTQEIPASSPIARVENGMSDVKVRGILGEPAGQRNYPTFNSFLPWSRDGWRVAWHYPNVGRVVFSRNRWNGEMTVVERVHDPSQVK